MTSAELTEWMAFSLLEPFGQSRTDDGARMVASMVYNMNRGQNAKAIMPSELMPVWRPKEQLDEEARALAAAAWFEARAVAAD